MRITHLFFAILALYFLFGCNNTSCVVVPKDMKLEAPHEINCENMFVVGNNLVMINNSGNYLFDYYNLPGLSYVGSFGQLSRDGNGFSMIPSPDFIRVLNDTSFVSDDRIVTFKPSDGCPVEIEFYDNSHITSNSNIDSILNSKATQHHKIYSRSDLIDGKIYSLLYEIDSNHMPIYTKIPEFHVYDLNYNLLGKFMLSYPMITFAVSNKYGKLYTISAKNENTIQAYDFPLNF